jgi:signal transduction histidine kinase
VGGAGLGLSIVQAIAEAHGGRAEVGETPAGGARFSIEVPLSG